MKEYEYSFKVNNLEPFFQYCRDNGFVMKDKYEQTRTIYRNPNKTMARITIKKYLDHEKKLLDFKEDNLVEGAVLKELRESLPIEYVDDVAVESILEFLNYKRDNTMLRIRTVYEIENAKFEFDEFISPEVAKVVSVEGEKELVDKIYNEIKDIPN